VPNARPAQANEGEAAEKGEGGRGLIGLRERAEMLGGGFEAGPEETGGFRVLMRLPRAG